MCMAMKALTQRVQLLQLSRFRRHSSGTLPFVFLLIVVVTACDLGAAPSCDLGFGSGGGSGIGPAFDGIEAAGEGAAGASEGVAGAGEVVGGVAVDGSEVVGEVAVDAGEVVGEFIEQIESVGSSVWYEVEDSAVRVSWDLADGADYYKVYYSDFIDSFCTLSRDGSPSFCKELAGNVAGTTYVHANPASDRNYYWVVACNRGGCSDIDSGNLAALIETGPAGPANVWYEVEDSAVRVSWDLVDGADYYKVYYSDFVDSFCTLSGDGSPSFCEELAGNVVGTTYVHADPDSNKNYYWVVACNRGGCSDIDSGNPAAPIETGPAGPANVEYEVEDSAVRVSWDLVDGADYYKVYYSDFVDSFCTLSGDGSPSFCEELAGNVVGTTYVHADPDSNKNYYWVVACNRGGCSDIDSGNPAAPIETGPAGPANVEYEVEDSEVRVSWDLVDGADYYKVYYSDFVDSFCTLSGDGSPSFCEELAGNVAGTTYVHADPDSSRNYYWVVACNRGGCSDIDSNNPAEDASLSTTAPTASPSPEQPRPPTVVPAATPTPTPTESDMSRRSFEASTPSGYTRVSLTDKKKVWGIPERFTSDSSLGAVAYMLLGSVKGCSLADEELDRSSIVYVKGERLGRLSTYESQEVCQMASSAWDTGWDGIKITHLRIFDESSPTNAMEYAYDPDIMQYIESSGASGSS